MESDSAADDNSDPEVVSIKEKLIEFGFTEENLSKEEMRNLLKALTDSKSYAKEKELLIEKDQDSNVEPPSPKQKMCRRQIPVSERRLPWSILPLGIDQAQKTKCMSVYIKLMSVNHYRQARLATIFTPWASPIPVPSETNMRVQPIRSTRSGRNVPTYSQFDDDSYDMSEFVIKKSKKRKSSNSEISSVQETCIYTKKGLNVKRKGGRDEFGTSEKHMKLDITAESEVDEFGERKDCTFKKPISVDHVSTNDTEFHRPDKED